MVVKVQSTKGFRIQKRTARLVFSGDYEGAEVVVRLDVPVGVFIDIQDMVANDEQQSLQIFKVFGEKVLEEWNIEDDDGQTLPTNSQGMQKIPLQLANLIIEQWVEVCTQPPIPLD